jgi:hypothetical protein
MAQIMRMTMTVRTITVEVDIASSSQFGGATVFTTRSTISPAI